MEHVDVSGNAIGGTLPREWAAWGASLLRFYVENTDLSGSLPADEFTAWTNVLEFFVYDTRITFENGTTHNFQYRERPELLFDDAGRPKHLLTGVEWGRKDADPTGCASFSVVTDIGS